MRVKNFLLPFSVFGVFALVVFAIWLMVEPGTKEHAFLELKQFSNEMGWQMTKGICTGPSPRYTSRGLYWRCAAVISRDGRLEDKVLDCFSGVKPNFGEHGCMLVSSIN